MEDEDEDGFYGSFSLVLPCAGDAGGLCVLLGQLLYGFSIYRITGQYNNHYTNVERIVEIGGVLSLEKIWLDISSQKLVLGSVHVIGHFSSR